MDTLVLVLFIVAWAAIIFAIVRALVTAWGVYRRLAVGTAVAVAGAFALGAMSPFALPSRNTVAEQAAAPAAAQAPVADTSRVVSCPPGANVAKETAPGHLDNVGVGAGPLGAPPPALSVPPGTPIEMGGWIVLDTGLPSEICAIVDGRTVAAATRYGIERPDVATALGKPDDAPSGFVVTVRFPRGTHTVAIGAVEPDGRTVEAIAGGSLRVVVQ